jgi:hypothetical protein
MGTLTIFYIFLMFSVLGCVGGEGFFRNPASRKYHSNVLRYVGPNLRRGLDVACTHDVSASIPKAELQCIQVGILKTHPH